MWLYNVNVTWRYVMLKVFHNLCAAHDFFFLFFRFYYLTVLVFTHSSHAWRDTWKFVNNFITTDVLSVVLRELQLTTRLVMCSIRDFQKYTISLKFRPLSSASYFWLIWPKKITICRRKKKKWCFYLKRKSENVTESLKFTWPTKAVMNSCKFPSTLREILKSILIKSLKKVIPSLEL